MSKRVRQYLGLISAVIAYYIVHEGAHLVCTLIMDTFKQVNFIGLGVQIDVYYEKMTDVQMGVFCLVGSVATLTAAYILVLLTNKITQVPSKAVKACMYYITLAMLLIDPVYLGILFKLFSGGDMNGISLLIPEIAAQSIYALLLVLNVFIFWKIVLPKYKRAFSEE